MISIEVYRMRIGLHYSQHAKVKGIAHLNFFELLIVLSLLFIGGREKPWPVVFIFRGLNITFIRN